MGTTTNCGVLRTVCQPRGLKRYLDFTARCMSGLGAKKCYEHKIIEPEYFKAPKGCKSDEELKSERSLGVYLRCKPPYKPECMETCFNLPRIDKHLYRPSKSLDRTFRRYWVDCVVEDRPSRMTGYMTPPEVTRRGPLKPRCAPAAKVLSCRTLRPLVCRPLKPVSVTAETRCIKFPLCECPATRKKIRCKIERKKICKVRRLTRYPSFSECQSPPISPDPKTECYKRISICEAWRSFRNKHRSASVQ